MPQCILRQLMAKLRILDIIPMDKRHPRRGALVTFRLFGMPKNVVGILPTPKFVKMYGRKLSDYQFHRIHKYL